MRRSDMAKRYIALTVTAMFLLVAFPLAAKAESMEGYDENTEMNVKGIIREVGSKGMHGPLIVKIANGKAYYIVTAPAWYLRTEKINFQVDSHVEITGSKYFGKDGQLYVIARKIKDTTTGKEIFLRDSRCMPMWHGMRNR
jgi:hypothetical protein